jgi:hypothetical protein
MNLIKRIWNGELPLVKVYWLYGVAFGSFIAIFSVLIKDYSTGLIVLTVALIPYQILVVVGTWRSANAYKNKKIWAVLAKIHVVFGVIAALNNFTALAKGFSFDNTYKLTNCVRCDDGNCEPSTIYRSAEVKLLPKENQMKVLLEFWGKDKNGNYEKEEEILLNSSLKDSKLKCAIKSENDGFCSFEFEPSKILDFIDYEKQTFVFDGKKYTNSINHHYIFNNNEEKRTTVEHSCS